MQHTFGTQFTSGGVTLNASIAKTANGEIDEDISLTNTQVDKQHNLSWVNAKLVSLYILSDQDVMLETNAADATGGKAIHFKKGEPFFWHNTSGVDNPFAANDVVTTYWTNESAPAVAANIKVRGLFDPIV